MGTTARVIEVATASPLKEGEEDEKGEKAAANEKNGNQKGQQHFIVVIEGLAKFDLKKVCVCAHLSSRI